MREPLGRLRIPEWLILIGSSLFIAVLAISAYFEPDIRWLHFFQAWMYGAAILLGLRGNRWGYFIGFSAALLWDYANLFVTTFFMNGIEELIRCASAGHQVRPDLLLAIPAWLSNLTLIVGCVWAYKRMRTKEPFDIVRLLLAFALTTGFFAGAMELFQPRYLAMFPELLHPRWPIIRP